jgi:hypothetical protein
MSHACLFWRAQRVTEVLEADSAALSQILGKAVSACRAAEAAKKARELVRGWHSAPILALYQGLRRAAALYQGWKGLMHPLELTLHAPLPRSLHAP